jgi:hypothetical protein
MHSYSPSENNRRTGRNPSESFLFAAAAVAVAVGFGVAAGVFYLLRSKPSRDASRLRNADSPELDSPTLPLPPPKALKADTVDAFLDWVAAVPHTQRQTIREAVALARGDDAVHDALIEELFNLPAADFGRHLMLLSVIGELGRPDSAQHLIRFLSLPGSQVFPMPPVQQGRGLHTSFLDYGAGLQARAVEMLAHLRTEEALNAVLDAASSHESKTVRIAAFDAYLFVHEDSQDAHERMRSAARPEEAKLVGLARRTAQSNAKEFDERLAEFYRRNPSEVPPTPDLRRGIELAPSRSIPVTRS